MNHELSFEVTLHEDFQQAIEKVTVALKEEGFGVLTHIDVKETMKNKLDVEFRQFAILGACNPPLAYKALSHNPLVGLLLPCNVTVEEIEGGGSFVNLIDPRQMLTSVDLFADDTTMKEIAEDARARLERVAQALAN